jgi:hypothetical protein
VAAWLRGEDKQVLEDKLREVGAVRKYCLPFLKNYSEKRLNYRTRRICSSQFKGYSPTPSVLKVVLSSEVGSGRH